MSSDSRVTRRGFLGAAGAVAAGVVLDQTAAWGQEAKVVSPAAAIGDQLVEPVIDIHQHTNYWGRSDAALLHHQEKMGVTHTILQPSGSPVKAKSTLLGVANGLYAGAGPVESCKNIAAAHPGKYFYCANEVPDVESAAKVIERQLKDGAIGIGESKFNLPCDSPEMQALYKLAEEYRVPILLHFQFETFNTGYKNFEAMLKKYPKVNFVGHAQLFWSQIDAKCEENVGYPKGKITAGGTTDRYLSDYPNFYADMSAGSGLNAMMRDEEHARGFLERHQDQCVYGSDCPDPAGHGPTCTGRSQINAIRRLSPTKAISRKILFENAKVLYKLGNLA